MRHLVEKPSGYFFQATKAMREAGMSSEPLGTNKPSAIRRAEQLNDQWDEIRKGQSTVSNEPVRGTISHLIWRLRKSAEWRDKNHRTTEEIEYALTVIEPLFGETHVRLVTAENCEDFYAGLREKGSVHKAGKIMKWLRYLFNYGIRTGYERMSFNPTYAVRIAKPAPRTQTWEESQVLDAITTATKQELHGVAVTIAIAYDTSLRPGDIRTLTWRQFDGESLFVIQGKTNKPLRVPLWPETLAALRAYRKAVGVETLPSALIVRTPTGKAYTRHHLAKQVRTVLRKAGIPDEIQLRDLRRTASKERADSGATEYELASSTGHSIEQGAQILDTYNPRSYEAAKRAQSKRRRQRIRNQKQEKSLKTPA